MNMFVWLGGIIALVVYFPLWMQIRSGKVEQNLLTWILWATLDGISTGAIMLQHGNFLLAAAYTVGSIGTAVVVLRSQCKLAWTWFETMVTCLVVLNIIIWYFSGSKLATIASSTALLIASIPQTVDAWEKPEEMPTIPYGVWTIANILSLVGGKGWSVEERLYPLSALLICFALFAISLRKYPRAAAKAGLI